MDIREEELDERGREISRKLIKGTITREEADQMGLELQKEYQSKFGSSKRRKKSPCGCKKKKPSLWSKFKFALRGSIGMLKYATKISKRTSGDHIKHRQRVCESCPIYDFGICIKELGGCGCTLYYKIRVEKEKCPKDKWGPVEEKAD
tara:strand:+ start:30 stop:473 length:444 start_codon:yes stop_codon:yes gene_type:complete